MDDPQVIEALVEEAFVYAYPLVAVARTRYRAIHDPGNPQRHSPNTVLHHRQLSEPAARWITAPNHDTLYSNAWLDLSAAPVRIRVGAMPAGRYWSVALMDAFTNHVAMLGQRLNGCGPVDVTLLGPQAANTLGAPGSRIIRAPGNDVWLFARWLVDGKDSLAATHSMQDQLELSAQSSIVAAGQAQPMGSANPSSFLAVVNEALARNPPPAADAGLLGRCAAVGLRVGDTDVWSSLDAGTRQVWNKQFEPLHRQLRQSAQRGRRDFQGWMAAAADIGNYGSNHALRASVALGGLGALEPSEAMYFVRYTADDGLPLDGHEAWVLRVPPEGIPTDSFWSFTLYAPTSDGQRVLVDNPIGRYAIGNRTHGLGYEADGSLEIALQRTEPAERMARANWLPTPNGPFQIALRAYLPRPALRDGLVAMPSIMRRDQPPLT